MVEESIPKVRLHSHLTYTRTTDLKDHVTTYEGHMYLFTYSEEKWCNYFPTMLTGVALKWFSKQTPGLITNFDNLVAKFKTRFVSNNRRENYCLAYFGAKG